MLDTDDDDDEDDDDAALKGHYGPGGLESYGKGNARTQSGMNGNGTGNGNGNGHAQGKGKGGKRRAGELYDAFAGAEEDEEGMFSEHEDEDGGEHRRYDERQARGDVAM